MKAQVRYWFALSTGLLCLSVSPLTATVIYNNSTNDLVIRYTPTNVFGTYIEVGDEIILAGTDRYLTNFSFEYWGIGGASGGAEWLGNVEARVRFYLNDGTPFNGYYTPGTVFFDSGWFGGFSPTERSTLVFEAGVDFPSGGLFMPVESNMTWSVEFRGLSLGDYIGLDLYGPPVVGQNYPDYWENDGGWILKTNIYDMSFGAVFEAIPEPCSASILALAGLGILSGWLGLRRLASRR